MMPDTNDAIAQRRRLAQALMGEGTSTAPVQHWTQAAARVAQALSGSANMGYADSASKARETFDTQQAEAKQGANRAYAEGAMQREVQQKMQLAQQAGLQSGSPEFKQYVYGIKPPDPNADLERQLKEATIAKMRAEASGQGTSGLGLQPIYGRDAQGNQVVLQIGKDGRAVQTAMPEGVQVDLGARAGAQEMAKANAQAVVDLPKVQNTARRLTEQIDSVYNDPNLANVTGWEANFPTVFPESVDTEERAAQLTGGAFLQAFESLKGGGQITEVEGAKATAALARLQNLRQSDGGYKQALDDFRREVQELVKLAERKAKMGGSLQQQMPAQPQSGAPTHRWNPDTGKLEPFQGM